MFEVGVRVLLILFLISIFQALVVVLNLVVGGVSIHDMHVVITVCTLRQ